MMVSADRGLAVARGGMSVKVSTMQPKWHLARHCCCLTAPAQTITQRGDTGAPFSTRATHLLGFANARNNSTGTLSVQDDSLQFQQNGKPDAKVKVALVRDVFLGAESKQVGGLPMTLGKTAAPFGGGRVVSLFAHKKYDTLSLEYVDADG